MTEAIRKQLAAQGVAIAPAKAPRAPLSAQQTSALGLPACQVHRGVGGQPSVLRFYDLSPALLEALLGAAAGLGVYPVRQQ